MHTGEKPTIRNRKCKRCKLCMTRCNEDALVIGEKKSYREGASSLFKS